MKALSHVLTVAVFLAVFLGGPLLAHVDVAALGQDADVISSATVIQAAPTGRYVIYINTNRHTDAELLERWCAFFRGEDTELIMEDVSCVVVSGDASGLEMAESLQSRLAENQMKLRTEDATLELSKAEVGLFDVIVMSEEAASACGASRLNKLPFVVVIER